ncbi:MAG: hypothetical protein JNK11_14225, partial [Alphaproteobacteria bacterium]|nr:hypothetical protein [Alphaproteobacteria bacterium]
MSMRTPDTSGAPRQVLLLHAESARHIGTVAAHIQALATGSRHRVVDLDCAAAARQPLDLQAFDVIVFHYSIVIALPAYLPPAFFARLAAFGGPKLLFIQDEYRWVDRTAEAIRDLGISVVFTLLD